MAKWIKGAAQATAIKLSNWKVWDLIPYLAGIQGDGFQKTCERKRNPPKGKMVVLVDKGSCNLNETQASSTFVVV